MKIIVMHAFSSQIVNFLLCLNIPFGTLFSNKSRYISAFEGYPYQYYYSYLGNFLKKVFVNYLLSCVMIKMGITATIDN